MQTTQRRGRTGWTRCVFARLPP